MQKDALTLLGCVPFFDALNTDQLEQIASRLRRRRYHKGVTLFHEGDAGETLYLILSGRVQIQKIGASGQVAHIGHCGPGECFGELALIDGEPRMADAVTASDCELLLLEREQFIRCIEATPRIALTVMASLAQRLRASGKQLVRHRELNVQGRLAQALLSLADAHGQTDATGETRITVLVSHQEIADQIGASREAVSRGLAEFRRTGAVRKEGHTLILCNMTLLRRLCVV